MTWRAVSRLDISVLAVSTPPPPPLPPLPPPPRPQRWPLWRPSRISTRHPTLTQQQTPPLQPPTPEVRTRTTPALTETAPSPHASVWSVTCESIAQRLTNQRLEHQPTLAALASTCPRTFTHRMGLFGHTRIHEGGIGRTPDTPTTPSPTLTSSPCAPTTISATDTDTADFSCPHCPCTFISRIDLVGPKRIHRTKTDKPVLGAPIYTHRTRLQCPRCPRTFTHRMGLLGHMHIHEHLR
nr:unnamed protein product [Spirometra erinaceieuropaei]